MLLAEQGNVAEAAALLEQSLAENPNDEGALAALCELADRLPRGFDLDARLTRALAELPPPPDQPAARSRRARLWQQHAELLEPKDPRGPSPATSRSWP